MRVFERIPLPTEQGVSKNVQIPDYIQFATILHFFWLIRNNVANLNLKNIAIIKENTYIFPVSMQPGIQ